MVRNKLQRGFVKRMMCFQYFITNRNRCSIRVWYLFHYWKQHSEIRLNMKLSSVKQKGTFVTKFFENDFFSNSNRGKPFWWIWYQDDHNVSIVSWLNPRGKKLIFYVNDVAYDFKITSSKSPRILFYYCKIKVLVIILCFNVERIEICARNVINSKCYASHKNKPLHKLDGFHNLSYAW